MNDFESFVYKNYTDLCRTSNSDATRIDTLTLYNVSAATDALSFSMSVDVPGGTVASFDANLSLDTGGPIIIAGGGTSWGENSVIEIVNISPAFSDPSLYFIGSSDECNLAHLRKLQSKGLATYASLPSYLENEAVNYWNAIEHGLPSAVSGSAWRMFYFSAITITTLGFGDIVPVTIEARLIVAIEAVLGIVTIGLFLNSLSQNHKNRP